MAYPKRTHCKMGHDFSIVGKRNGGCAECANDRTRRWRDNHRGYFQEVVKPRNRERNLSFRGITLAEYDAKALSQGGVCAICGQEPPMRYGEMRLHVDHDHTSGKVRGLLCQRCNIGIGQFSDDPEKLASAIRYLEKWNAPEARN